METVKVKNIEIGKGIPKICIPVTGSKSSEIEKELEIIREQKPDLAEWRVDCYKEGKDSEKTWEMLKTISDRLGQIPLIFTFRTAKEGGSREIAFEDYVKLLEKAAKTGLADLIDVEAFFCEKETKSLIESLKKNGVRVIASNHHFDRTPAQEEIVERMRRMEACGADILKIAVMPENTLDVCTLLAATAEIREESNRPVITMSMGKTGVLSRICGEFTGSCVTFAAGVRASAPGQIEAEKMREILAKLHETVEG